jgi:hypothetical protein
MKSILLQLAALTLASVPVSALTVGFEDLPFPPAPNGTTGLQYATASGDGSLYSGIVWDSRVVVAGSQYRVDTATPGPLFGLPHSGAHFITNESSMDGGNGITLATTMVLTGGWFGQVEYYGFGGGADAITIHALNGSTSLGFVTFTLPESNAGQPEPLSFVDTSSFTGLSGITGYRIDRNSPEPFADNWVADDLQFVPVPEPRAMAMAAGILMVGFAAWRRCSR